MKTNDKRPESLLRKAALFLSSGKKLYLGGSLILLAGIAILLQQKLGGNQAAAISNPLKLTSLNGLPANERWGFDLDDYIMDEVELRPGDVLGEILMGQGMTYPQVNQLVVQCKDKFNISSFRIGQKLHFLTQGISPSPRYMVYEPSPYQYTIFQLQPPYEVSTIKREVKTEIIAASGVLETSFWQALTDNGLSDALADGMIDVLASSVDFYHQKVGDRFKVVFEQH